MSKQNYFQDNRHTEKLFLKHLHGEASADEYVKAVKRNVEARVQRMILEAIRTKDEKRDDNTSS